MLRTLLLGLGRAGAGLHLPVLARARATHPELFAGRPVVGVDPGPRPLPGGPPGTGGDPLVIADSLQRARRCLDPDVTVVHLCTPPDVRAALLEEAAQLGYRRFVVEKPLAADRAALRRVREAVDRHGLRVEVVSPWLHSALTDRIAALLATAGQVRSVSVTQDKARFRRSLTGGTHRHAFEVEVPHALGVLLRLLGDGEVCAASWSDLRLGERVVPHMGGARLALRHRGGARGLVDCDLTSPVRRRRITVDTADGVRLIGHYPVAQDDDVARLDMWCEGRRTRELFEDDALRRCLVAAYRRFAGDDPPGAAGCLGVHARTVELLEDARHLAAGGTIPRLPRPGGPAAPGPLEARRAG
ncbi:hypothetical protein [Streptomyces griseoaurantiacus]|uniref:Oxidoreductase n=1 Tax=Streptomyces griseoaurantiacus TaxID=68213 RepID=A0A7W2DVV2_9ACTN|nr:MULTISPECIES: hypothetical protein [Streptomyces]MBA5223951.1 hypothetical protein [Streptomyces griseoaurantiacus]